MSKTLKEGSKVIFRQPVYAEGNSGLIYPVGVPVNSSEVTEQALSQSKAWCLVKEEETAVEPSKPAISKRRKVEPTI